MPRIENNNAQGNLHSHCVEQLNKFLAQTLQNQPSQPMVLPPQSVSLAPHNTKPHVSSGLFPANNCSGINSKELCDKLIDALENNLITNVQMLNGNVNPYFKNLLACNNFIRKLEIVYNDSYSSLLDVLQPDSKLRELTFRGKADNLIIEEITSLFAKKIPLQTLIFHNMTAPIHELEKLKDLFSAIKETDTLENLTIRYVNLKGAMPELCEVLKNAKNLKILSLSSCAFDSQEELEAFAKALKVNHSLTTLNLHIYPHSDSIQILRSRDLHGMNDDMKQILLNALVDKPYLEVNIKKDPLPRRTAMR